MDIKQGLNLTLGIIIYTNKQGFLQATKKETEGFLIKSNGQCSCICEAKKT